MRTSELTTSNNALWDVEYYSTSDQEDNDSDDSSDEDEEEKKELKEEARRKRKQALGVDVVKQLLQRDDELYKRDISA